MHACSCDYKTPTKNSGCIIGLQVIDVIDLKWQSSMLAVRFATLYLNTSNRHVECRIPLQSTTIRLDILLAFLMVGFHLGGRCTMISQGNTKDTYALAKCLE